MLSKKPFAKNKLKLFPIGALLLTKETKPSMAIVAGHGLQLQVQPPKVDMDNVAGAAVPFFLSRAPLKLQKQTWSLPLSRWGNGRSLSAKTKRKLMLGTSFCSTAQKKRVSSSSPPRSKRLESFVVAAVSTLCC